MCDMLGGCISQAGFVSLYLLAVLWAMDKWRFYLSWSVVLDIHNSDTNSHVASHVALLYIIFHLRY